MADRYIQDNNCFVAAGTNLVLLLTPKWFKIFMQQNDKSGKLTTVVQRLYFHNNCICQPSLEPTTLMYLCSLVWDADIWGILLQVLLCLTF